MYIVSVRVCFFTLINLYLIKNDVRAQSSPCPNYFSYRNSGKNIQGLITLPALRGINNLQVQIVFLGNYDKTSAIGIDFDDMKSARNSFKNGGNVHYRIDFPANLEHTPEILSIVLNEQQYCDNQDVLLSNEELLILGVNFMHDAGGLQTSQTPATPSAQKITEKPNFSKYPADNIELDFASVPISPSTILEKPVYQETNSNRDSSYSDRDWLQTLPQNGECGIQFTAVHTIINGMDITPNQFPWLVALFDHNRSYFCGGSLISKKHVITAAHCCVGKNWIFLEFGKHLLSDRKEPGTVSRISQRIINHPDYRPNTGHADISLIILGEEVSFTDKIKPICLWPFPSHQTGANGTVAGWGSDISGSTTDTPMAADVAIVSNEECLASNKLFLNITSDTTFCAGGKNKGPCSGDSGAGFILNDDNRWYLKGIISVSLSSNPRGGVCDVNKFAVYCDVAKYLGWLKTHLL